MFEICAVMFSPSDPEKLRALDCKQVSEDVVLNATETYRRARATERAAYWEANTAKLEGICSLACDAVKHGIEPTDAALLTKELCAPK
jgi:hypothetical protein